ncbi:MAG: hypothetical protein ACTSW1_05490 [Candidatus Hodarchaeales archaeon]
MAAKTVVTQAKIYTKIGDELDPVTGNLDIPSGASTLTAFKAMVTDGVSATTMANAGSVLVEIRGVEYAIPIVLNS